MEKPKILGVTEKPTEEDLKAGRMQEDASTLHALSQLVKNPEKTKFIADLITYPQLSQKLHELLSLRKSSDQYEVILMEAFDMRSKCEELEERVIERVKEDFARDLFAYLDRLQIDYDKEDLETRVHQVMIKFLDFVRYFGNAINLNTDLEEACSMSGYYIADSNSISINLSGIDELVVNSRIEAENQEAFRDELINSTLRHELVHALSYQNFWVTENLEDGGDQTDSRRIGVKGLSLDRERTSLVLLNEAITEKLNQETLSTLLPGKEKEIGDAVVAYEKEIEILNTLCKFVDWSFFVSACLSKHGLLSLAKELKRKTGLTLTEIDDAMKIDHQNEYKDNYTINFIESRVMG